MPVGGQGNSNQIDQQLTGYALNLRNLMTSITNTSQWINGQGNSLTFLESIGYSSTANTSNPGNVSDAQLALNMLSYFTTISAVYYGTLQQGGTGGTGATTFNFNQELSQLWAGQ
jgi:hypothetical protein